MDDELFWDYICTLTDEEICYVPIGELIRRAKRFHNISD